MAVLKILEGEISRNLLYRISQNLPMSSVIYCEIFSFLYFLNSFPMRFDFFFKTRKIRNTVQRKSHGQLENKLSTYVIYNILRTFLQFLQGNFVIFRILNKFKNRSVTTYFQVITLKDIVKKIDVSSGGQSYSYSVTKLHI
jgi:hypothetical protein